MAAIGILGFVVYINNPHSITHQSFLPLSIFAVLWGIFNYLTYQFDKPEVVIWVLRISVFFAVWYALALFNMLYVVPKEKVKFPKIYWVVFLPIVVLTSFFTLTPLVFKEVTGFVDGRVTSVQNAPGVIAFAIISISLVIGGMYVLFSRIISSKSTERTKLVYVLIGVIITYSLIIVFNLILPAFFDNTYFIPFAALFTLPFIALTAYAVIKHRLFDLKVVAVSILTFVLAVVTLIEVIFADSWEAISFQLSVFILVLLFGFLLIRNVLREVRQRERIERLAKDLEEANEQQTTLIHFITHQIKGFFTKSRNIFATLLEGDLGKIPTEAKPYLEEGFRSDTKAVNIVQDILKAANIRKGTLQYEKKDFDLRPIFEDVVQKGRAEAEDKNLTIKTKVEDGDFVINGDKSQIEHAMRNLLDNAIKYTPAGEITLSLFKKAGKTVFSVSDMGIGIDKDELPLLFREGGRGKDALKTNTESSGYGLYIVKSIVEAHGGRVWAESKGKNQGSVFSFELP